MLPADRPAMVIDLAAIRANWQAACHAFTGSGVGAVVKQDAYGLGLTEIAPFLSGLGCRDFWVANLTEAEAVRRVVPHGRIFVLHGLAGASLRDFRAIDAIPVLVDLDEARQVAAAAGEAPATVALHLDTGLTRFGLDLDEVRRLCDDPDTLTRLAITAHVTHLAHFSNPFARENRWQWRRFMAWTRHLPPAALSFCASAGAFGARAHHADLARIGSALYGVETTPARPQPIVPAARLLAPVLRVHEVKAGREVGYGGSYRTPSRRRLAELAIGYGDGIPFHFPKPAFVLISGFRAQIVGTCAMSLMSVDVTDLPENAVRPGMRAVLFGPDLPVDQIAIAAGVAPNVVHVRAGRSVPRFYQPAPDLPAPELLAAPAGQKIRQPCPDPE